MPNPKPGGFKKWLFERFQSSEARQERVVDECLRALDECRRHGEGGSEEEFFDLSASYHVEREWLLLMRSEKLLAKGRRLDADLPKKVEGHIFCRVNFWMEGDPNPPLYLSEDGFVLVRQAVREAERIRREKIALLIALVASLSALVPALHSVFADSSKPVQVILQQPHSLSTLPPAIWRDPATFDPIDHFFLFPAPDTPKLKWTGEVRPLR